MIRRVAIALLLLGTELSALAGVRVAVVPFDNGGAEEFSGLSVGLQSMVTTDLSQANAVTVVERAKIADLLAELRLAKDGVIDPATAAEIGKLTGATHVVAGSFTVVGDTMRLDARLADVQSGEVAVATEMSGEKEAFFELEKELVKKLLAELGAALSPKERAAVGRLHTADFDSFRRFGEGLELFDADRYQEAVSVLESVSASDPQFSLASMSLEDVRDVQARAERKAQAAAIASAEEDFAVRRESARADAEILRGVRAIAADPARHWEERATANLMLVSLTGAQMRGGRLRELEAATDRWALHRLGERAYQAYWAELFPRAPEFFPAYSEPRQLNRSLEFSVEAYVAKNREVWFTGAHESHRLSSCSKALSGVDDGVLEMLWVSRIRQLELHEQLLDSAADCLEVEKRVAGLLEVANSYAKEGRYRKSSALLKRLTDLSTEERMLNRVAIEAKNNAKKLEELESFPVGSVHREALALRMPMRGSATAKGLRARPERALSDVHYYVRSALPIQAPIFVGGVPMWSIPRDHSTQLVTGARSARDVTGSLRHYVDTRKFGAYGVKHSDRPTVLVMGGVPRTAMTAAITLDFEPAADWWPPQFRETPPGWEPLADRPTAGLLLALREIEAAPLCDPADPTQMTPVPTTALGVLIREGELIVAELEESYPEPDSCTRSPNQLRDLEIVRVLGRQKIDTAAKVKLSARLQGTQLIATAGQKKLVVELERERGGFAGLFADGEGYVELSEPSAAGISAR